jgi:uncharacterized membrane protein YjjB (DUF3815 family)
MITLLYATIGTLGYGLIFNVRKDKLAYVMIGGLINSLTYIITFNLTNNIFLSSGMCAFVTSLYSEISAILLKCPSTIFILTGLMPSLPGSRLFYTMQNLVLGNSSEAFNQGIITLEIVLGIVSGMLFASVFSTLISTQRNKIE